MRLTLPYASEEVTVPASKISLTPSRLVLPNRLKYIVLKAKQMTCSHEWTTTKNITLFNNHTIKETRCCKCKKKKID